MLVGKYYKHYNRTLKKIHLKTLHLELVGRVLLCTKLQRLHNLCSFNYQGSVIGLIHYEVVNESSFSPFQQLLVSFSSQATAQVCTRRVPKE